MTHIGSQRHSKKKMPSLVDTHIDFSSNIQVQKADAEFSLFGIRSCF